MGAITSMAPRVSDLWQNLKMCGQHQTSESDFRIHPKKKNAGSLPEVYLIYISVCTGCMHTPDNGQPLTSLSLDGIHKQ